MPTKESFEYESLQDIDAIVRHLGALADGLKHGKLSLASNGNVLVLHPSGLLTLAIEAKRGKRRARLLVKVSWREEEPGAKDDRDPLKINANPA